MDGYHPNFTHQTFVDAASKKIGRRITLYTDESPGLSRDFGNGHSSFAYLKSLPVDFLKIDAVYVKGIADDPLDLAIVRSINEIGQVMDKRIIAGFVESEQVAEKLREIGVDYYQGYFAAEPMPIETLA